MESKWIKFAMYERPKNMVTDIYAIVTKELPEQVLGTISWYGPWRCYSFFPSVTTSTVFERQCLSDIVKFIDKLMSDRKIAKQNEKQEKL